MREDQAAQVRDFDGELGFFLLHVRPAEQDQRSRLVTLVFPVPLDRGDFCRLMLKCIETVEVTDDRLDRRDDQCHPHGHREHFADRRVVLAAQQMPGRGGTHEEGRSYERRRGHVHQAIGKRRVEDNGQPVGGYDLPVDDLEALGGLHPAVGRENPEGRDQRTDGHHHGGEEVQATPDLVPAKQHDPQEPRLEEERREHFISQQRPGNRSGEVREAAPVGTELIGHDQAGNHAHAEVDGKDLRPEMVEVTVGVVMGFQPQAFEYRQVTRQADGDGRKQDVERDGERELNSGEIKCL
ncbi:hypothetical protein D3C81_1120410 [compost metagenome]